MKIQEILLVKFKIKKIEKKRFDSILIIKETAIFELITLLQQMNNKKYSSK